MSKRKSHNPESREATIRDVSREAGVSAMTVSRVINRKGHVSEATAERVREAIARVNYKPNVGARRLSGGRTYQLLMLFNNPNVTWIAEVLIGSMHACREIGYHLLLEGVGDFEGESPDAPIDYDEIAELVDRSRVDGVILPPPICFDNRVLEIIRQKSVPCVRIAGSPARDISLRVSIDNIAGAHDIADHLISMGHRNLAIVRGPENFVASALRFEGFAAALRGHGLDLPACNITRGEFDGQSGYVCARELLQLPDRPTAIFASNDEMAAGVLSAAQELKISVPDQLSVAGFDDAPIARSVFPRLTTVRQPLRAMGEKSVELLEDYIRHLDTNTADTIRPSVVLDYELKVRQSTGPLAADKH